MDCSGEVQSVNEMSCDEKHRILKRSGVFEETNTNFFVCEAHFNRLDKNFHKNPICLYPGHDKDKTTRIKPSELDSARVVELELSKIIFEKDGTLIPFDGFVCSTCKNKVFGNYDNPRKRKLKDKSVYESPPSGSGLSLLSGSEGGVSGSPGSDFKPNSQDLQTERQDNLRNLLVLNNLPKRHLSHDLRLTNPIAGLHPDTQNKILQTAADGVAAVINTITSVKEDQINIWHRLKDGPYMEDRLQVPGSEKPDSLVRDMIIAHNKSKSKKKTQVNRNKLVKIMNIY